MCFTGSTANFCHHVAPAGVEPASQDLVQDAATSEAAGITKQEMNLLQKDPRPRSLARWTSEVAWAPAVFFSAVMHLSLLLPVPPAVFVVPHRCFLWCSPRHAFPMCLQAKEEAKEKQPAMAVASNATSEPPTSQAGGHVME